MLKLRTNEADSWQRKYSAIVQTLEKERREKENLKAQLFDAQKDIQEAGARIRATEATLHKAHENVRENAMQLEDTLAQNIDLRQQNLSLANELKEKKVKLNNFMQGLAFLKNMEC